MIDGTTTDRVHHADPCARFEARLPEYVEALLPAAERAECDAHRAVCPACDALATDFAAIVRDAAALPTLRPERDLWRGIAERIDAPVVPLDARRPDAVETAPADGAPGDRPGVRPRVYRVTRRWLAVAAGALVAFSSALTYAVSRVGTAPDATDGAPRPLAATTPAITPTPLPVATPEPSRDPAPDATVVPRAADARLASTRGTEALGEFADAAAQYDREIAALRGVVRERRTDLDTGTVRVLEESLRIIDRAIAQSREALARDPASQFLGEQLTRTLDAKVQLLRTAALLPPRDA